MQRAFKKQVGRYQAGDVRDWPVGTWEQLARSVRQPLDSFSVPVDQYVRDATRPPDKEKKR